MSETAKEAVKQTTDAAIVVDKIASHLGDAANTLAAKFALIVEQYGPNAAALIREVGRVTAFKDFGTFVFFFGVFLFFSYNFLKTWKDYDGLLIDGAEKDIKDSKELRLLLFGIISAFTLVVSAFTFNFAALYGLLSPEAYLVIKLLKW